jgi:hypothetical protein
MAQVLPNGKISLGTSVAPETAAGLHKRARDRGSTASEELRGLVEGSMPSWADVVEQFPTWADLVAAHPTTTGLLAADPADLNPEGPTP